MAFEASALDVEGGGKTVLGRFSDESLSFRICYSQSSIYCEEETLHFRVPLLLPLRLPSGGSPDHWQTFLRCCFGTFMERRGLEVFPRLSGGGCICSSHLDNLEGKTPTSNNGIFMSTVPHVSLEADSGAGGSIEYGRNKSNFLPHNQIQAFDIAEEVEKFAERGRTAGMRLVVIGDLPQVTIKEPYLIGKTLLDALCKEELWSLPNDYLVRATIARLARRNLMDHLFLNRQKYPIEITKVLNKVLELASLRERNWLESGVLAECRTMNMLVTIASRTEWWQELPPVTNVLYDAYTSSKCTLAPPVDLLTNVWKKLDQKSAIEFQLLVDNIYWILGASNSELTDGAVQTISELLALNKSWENLYAVLTCLEWGIHRDKLRETQINQLKPSLEVLTTVSSVNSIGVQEEQWRVCEKVATILIKLSYRNWLTDLLEKMKTEEHDPRVSRLFTLNPNELYVEPRLNVLINVDAVPNFSGRESELQQVKERFKTSELVKITGVAGSGKTSLALTLARSLSNQYDVIWKCSADSEANLSFSFKELAQRLNIGEKFSDLLNWLRFHPALLLLDNLDSDLPEQFQDLLKGSILKGSTRVLLTSRNPRQEDMRISRLDARVAVDFVIGLTERDSERQDIDLLCQELSYLPLALKNVSALLNANKEDSVMKVVQWIRDSPAELDSGNSGSTPRMMLILTECVKKVTSEAGKRLLFIIADLSPDIIPGALYKEIFDGGDVDLRQAKNEAQALSLIQEDEQHNLSVHRLIQQVIRSCYPDQVLGLLSAKVQAFLHLFNYKERSELNVALSKSIDCIINGILNKPLPEPEEVSLCSRFVYFCMKKLGIAKAVVEIYKKCCIWWEKRTTVTDQNVSDLQCVARCCLDIPSFAQAEQFMIQVIDFHQIGSDQETLATSYINLACVYKAQGKLEATEEFNLKALNIREAVLSPTHPDLAASYNNLANVYSDQGKHGKAEEFYLKALKIREAVLSPTHPKLAASYYNLGIVYAYQRKLGKAEEFYLKALNIREAVLSPTHPDLAASYSNLAIVYQAQGKLGKAEEFSLKALEIFELSRSDRLPIIARGITCVLCSKALNEQETQYLCPYCEPLHYHCQACEDQPREGHGSAKLAHPHKVYKITSASGHFNELRFGKNFPEDPILAEDSTNRVHNCTCDNTGGCDGKVEGTRYKCAHCRDVDFCEACEKLFWGTATEEMKEKIKAAGHEEWHVLLKIPFP